VGVKHYNNLFGNRKCLKATTVPLDAQLRQSLGKRIVSKIVRSNLLPCGRV